MMMRVKDILEKEKIIAIVRGVKKERILDVAEALYQGGIRFVEVTFDSYNRENNQINAEKIALLNRYYESKLMIGAGTVMTCEQVDLAIEAGARYIISPNTNKQVIHHTRQKGALAMPGAVTPTEIAKAYESGADYVKVFPAGNLGAKYISAIKSSMSAVPLLAVGGIGADNIKAYIEAGSCGVGIGSHIVDKEIIQREQYDLLAKKAEGYVNIIHSLAQIL